MPQKKTAKHTRMKKPTAKRQMQKGILSLAKKIENEFFHIPKKLAKLYRQEWMIQKQQQSKLNTEIKKAKSLQKTIQKKQAVLMKKNATQSTKKQLTAVNKSSEQVIKKIKMHSMQLEQMLQHSHDLLAKQNKYMALHNELIKLEKQLTSTATQKKSVKPKMLKSPEREPTSKEVTIEETPFVTSSEIETVEL